MPTSLAAMLALFNDNTAGDISAADGRDVIQALYDWIPPLEKYKMGRLAGETAHASDDFFTTFSGYTETDITGTTTWSATRAGLSCIFAGQSANDFSTVLKAVPVAGVPITIETWADDVMISGNNPMRGVVFTDGTTSAANLAAFGKVGASAGATQYYQFTGTLTAVTATALGSQLFADIGKSFIRLTWISANTFGWSLSPDTENWTDFGQADLSTTFTPTHMGFFATSWGSSGNQVASFRYLRVYEADLSQ